jgi:hypothetical protein
MSLPFDVHDHNHGLLVVLHLLTDRAPVVTGTDDRTGVELGCGSLMLWNLSQMLEPQDNEPHQVPNKNRLGNNESQH